MGRVLGFIYGLAVYLVMFLTFLYMFGFLANFYVPKTIDSGDGASFAAALAINLGLGRSVWVAAQRYGASGLQALVDEVGAAAYRAKPLTSS